MPLPVHDTGSYEISITNEDGDQLVDEMVLVVPESDYPKTRAGFDVMKARTANWSGPGARGDEHLFLRAYLLSVTPT